jgi:hypothetical protein
LNAAPRGIKPPMQRHPVDVSITTLQQRPLLGSIAGWLIAIAAPLDMMTTRAPGRIGVLSAACGAAHRSLPYDPKDPRLMQNARVRAKIEKLAARRDC